MDVRLQLHDSSYTTVALSVKRRVKSRGQTRRGRTELALYCGELATLYLRREQVYELINTLADELEH